MPRPALRRALVLLLHLAVLAAVQPVPASATVSLPGASMTSFSPNASFTGGQAVVVVTTRGAWTGGQAEVTLTPTASPGDEPLAIGEELQPGQYRAALRPQGPSGSAWVAALDLRTPEGTPAAPGPYDAEVWLDGDVVERCTACFTVLTRSAPTASGRTALSPRVLKRGEELSVQIGGTSFADRTVVDVVLSGEGTPRAPTAGQPSPGPTGGAGPVPAAPAPGVTVTGPGASPYDPDTDGRLTRLLTVDPAAPLGHYDVRLTNSDGRTSTCLKCLTVTAPGDRVEPTGVTNDVKRVVRLHVPEVVPKGAKLRLTWAGTGAPDPSLDLTAASTVVASGTPSTLDGTVDFVGATPGLNAYHVGYVLPDGSVHDCTGVCRFTVRQALPPVITSLAGLSKVKTRLRTLTLTGTGFTRGTRLVSDDAAVVVTSVKTTSATAMTVVVEVDQLATGEPVTFAVTNPDGQSSQYTSDPLEPGPPGPVVPADADGTEDPDASRAPAPSSMRLERTVLSHQQSLVVSGQAEPGAALDLFGLTRPGDTPVLLRTLTAVADSGRYTFVVSPSSSTRYHVVARNSFGRSSSESLGVQVRSAVRLTYARPAGLRYLFSGSVLPARVGVRVTVFELTTHGRRSLGTTTTKRDGTWHLPPRTWPKRDAGKRLTLRAETGADARNASGASAPLVLPVS